MFLHRIHTFLLSKYKYLFLLLRPKENLVVFNNFNGRGYGCNPKYIAEYFLRANIPWHLVWLTTSGNDNSVPREIEQVKFRSIKAIYYLSIAKLVVTNVKDSLRIIKKSEQIILQTWHGEAGLKLAEVDARDHLSQKYITRATRTDSMTDYFISNSSFQTLWLERNRWTNNGRILETGFPRNDLFFHYNDDTILRIKKRLGIPSNQKCFLYAPTFRDDKSLDGFNIDYENLINAFNKTSSDKWTMLLRMHPNTNNYLVKNKNTIDVTTYPDVQELLLISDCLITDLSSLALDYVILKKPIIFYLSDSFNYEKNRGIEWGMVKKLPYRFCSNNNELINEVNNICNEPYETMADTVMKEWGLFESGDASKKVIDCILGEDFINDNINNQNKC